MSSMAKSQPTMGGYDCKTMSRFQVNAALQRLKGTMGRSGRCLYASLVCSDAELFLSIFQMGIDGGS